MPASPETSTSRPSPAAMRERLSSSAAEDSERSGNAVSLPVLALGTTLRIAASSAAAQAKSSWICVIIALNMPSDAAPRPHVPSAAFNAQPR
jgi:hypothetical protein